MRPLFSIRVHDDQQVGFSRAFQRFPVRIGSNPLNDLQLELPFVAPFHAVLEHDGTSIFVRDLGSDTGTRMGESRLPPDVPRELVGGSLRVGPLSIEVSFDVPTKVSMQPDLTQLASRDLQRPMMPNTMYSVSERSRDVIQSGEQEPHSSLGNTLPPKVSALIAELSPEIQRMRVTVDILLASISQRLVELEESSRRTTLQALADAHPMLCQERDFLRMLEVAGGLPPAQAAPERAVYLQILQIARNIGGFESESGTRGVAEGVPSVVPGSNETFAMVERIERILAALSRAVPPLRALLRDDTRPPEELDRLQTPAQAGHAMLNPREGEVILDAIESLFVDLLVQHTSMVSSAVTGLRGLLDDFSPSALARRLKAAPKKYGATFGPYRARALLRVLEERIAEDRLDERETLVRVLGRRIARAHRQMGSAAAYISSRPPPPAPRPRPDVYATELKHLASGELAPGEVPDTAKMVIRR